MAPSSVDKHDKPSNLPRDTVATLDDGIDNTPVSTTNVQVVMMETDDTATYSSNEPSSDISVSMVNIPASATDTSKPETDFLPEASTESKVIDNSARSDDSSEIPILDPKALNQTEENIQKDGVTVKLFSQNENGKKIWDKKHYCLYCNKPFAKLPRHLETKHKDEIDVIKLRSLDRRSKEQKSARATLIDKLRKAGNYNHNIEVLKSGQGEVVPKKSLSKSRSSDDYLPCRHCLGFYLKHDLYRHVSKCTFREEKLVKGTRHQSNSAFLLPSTASEKAGSDFQKDVVADMSVDNISLCARNDELIILFGEKLYKKHKALPHMHQYIRTKMRELSRFLLKAREEDEDIVTLSDCIQANKFETCVKAVRSLCGVKCGTKADIPSLALKIGFSLSKCANIRLSKALVEGDSKVQDNVERFQRLYSMDWNTEVSSTALKSLETKKWNKPSLLPLTNDVVKFQKYLDQQIDANIKLLESKNAQGWRPLCEAILVSIILFNRRRSGEVERLSLDVFSLKSKTDLMPDVKETLNNLEKHLVENLSRVETRGKRGRKVPILFPKKTEEALDLLIQYRSAAGIEKGNPYAFANNAIGYVRGADCMRSTASEAKLENPENMRSTNLRKHVATLSQVVNLRDNELDILAQFLGHDVKVHRNFYRLPEDTIQIAKVGKLLMAANKGTLGKFSGKSLDDISIDQEVSDESESEDETTQSTEVRDQDDADQDNEKAGKRNTRKSLHSTEATCMTQKPGSRRTVKRIPWTEEERSAVKSEMEHFLHIRKTPGKLDCDNCLRKYQCLSRRNWKNIKNFVYNCIQSLKKCH
ncbi:uncharacterized protein LOC132560656 [Ylistrum balloti]|uniref:uncharacterized protein LOC132560656 n=1 Tax=Ylistrum balloti TaxID=509963 RepID=UPI002905B7DB|nr:uncharacterized protein LOC132560656 [Ylistrum balloti]